MEGEVLTPEQAREVDLPSFLHPIRRVREIGRLAGEMSKYTKNVGWFPGEQTVFTRSGLVNTAEAYERVASGVKILKYMDYENRVYTLPEGDLDGEDF